MSDFELLPPEDLSVLMPDELIKLCFERWSVFEFQCKEIFVGQFQVDCWAKDSSGTPYQLGASCTGGELVGIQRRILMAFLAPGMAS